VKVVRPGEQLLFAMLRSRRTLLNTAARFDLFFDGGRRWRAYLAHTKQQLAAAEWVKSKATLPIRELVTLRDVIYLLNKTNKHKIKKSILQQYGLPLEEILLL
jgi:cell division inhibitor SulA